MDQDRTDTVDIGVDEKLNESFSTYLSLTNTVDPVAEQEVALQPENCQRTEPKEGDCYIFDYQKFEGMAKRLSPRNGSEKDAARLKHDFMQLNLDVHLHSNLTYDETFDVLKEASRKNYSKSKYFVCCFLTHGGENGGLWAKDKRMYINDILIIFSESSSLKGIPKIFITEACQGEEAELAVSTDSADSCMSTDTEDFPNFLIANSTYTGTVAFKTSNKKEEIGYGSYFIDEFCRSLEEFSSSLDLLRILTIVNCRMANMFLSHVEGNTKFDKKKQMPCFYSTLKEKIVFNRNIEPFVSKDTKWFDMRRKRHRSGLDSTNGLQSNRYCIKGAERVLFLSVAIENIFKDDSVLRSAFNLETDMGNRNYSCKTFQGNFQKSKILEFLNKSSKQSGTRNESKAKKTSEVDCLICYVASYSRGDSVCDAGGRKISKKDIVEKFIGQMNKTFVGKPKIFIFLLRKLHMDEKLPGERFCEDFEPTKVFDTDIEMSFQYFNLGTDSVDGVTNQIINTSDRGLNASTESTNDECIGENLIPVHADILQICITVKDWEQAIGPMNLFQEILKKSPTEDLLSLLTEFNCELVEKHDFFKISKKSFSMISTLTKTLYLP
ncbi:unnamed protein product [Larinioides sclopetarius]|uniref:Caspase-8 n=1 Tax=Larinioides sclopetarius TaxID=280406 RepID=A0AAV2AVR4_9ARAC